MLDHFRQQHFPLNRVNGKVQPVSIFELIEDQLKFLESIDRCPEQQEMDQVRFGIVIFPFREIEHKIFLLDIVIDKVIGIAVLQADTFSFLGFQSM